jgi:hypothetical protein
VLPGDLSRCSRLPDRHKNSLRLMLVAPGWGCRAVKVRYDQRTINRVVDSRLLCDALGIFVRWVRKLATPFIETL